MNSAAIISGVVHKVYSQCCICGCEGDNCTTKTGEKCELANGLCTADGCQREYAKRVRDAKRSKRYTRKGRAA